MKKIVIIEKDCDNEKFSSNINKVIRTVLNFSFIYLFYFFYEKILLPQKAQKAQNEHNAQKGQTTQKAAKSTKRH